MRNDDADLKNKAYQAALHFNLSDFNEKTIYLKLRKQGFSKSIAKEVAKSIALEQSNDDKNNSFSIQSIWLLLFTFCILISISVFAVTDSILNAFFALLFSLIPTAVLGHFITSNK